MIPFAQRTGVIVLNDDFDTYKDLVFQKTAQKQFLKGYVESDSPAGADLRSVPQTTGWN